MNRVAIVTGSTRGIGRGIADALTTQGYRVVYSGTSVDRPADLPESHFYIGCDISDAQARTKLIDQTIQRFGRLDVMVNNAGVAPLKRMDVLETTEESFDRVLSINLKGTFFLCQHAAKTMLWLQEAELPDYHPRIINITSISAYTTSTSRAEYCISKAALSMVTQLFRDRLASGGIPVFEVRPGIIDTDMTSVVHEKYQALIDEGLTPIKRFGLPEDVAKAVLAACSGLLDFSSGQVLNADGGFELRRL